VGWRGGCNQILASEAIVIGNVDTAGPAELPTLIKLDARVEELRNLYCVRYDFCLDEAVQKGWASWACTRCQLFVPPTADAKDQASH
jgi:hypothetical protein